MKTMTDPRKSRRLQNLMAEDFDLVQGAAIIAEESHDKDLEILVKMNNGMVFLVRRVA